VEVVNTLTNAGLGSLQCRRWACWLWLLLGWHTGQHTREW